MQQKTVNVAEDSSLPTEAEFFSFTDKISVWPSVGFYLERACAGVHFHNKNWWIDLYTGKPLQRNVGEMLMLVVSEIAEGMEGHRKNLMDDKLPHRPMLEVELADAIIRIFDIAGGLNLDLAGAFAEKMRYNTTRADHSHAERLKENGKKY